MSAQTDVRSSVREYYGEILSSSADLKTTACCASGAPPAWLAPLVARVHPDVQARFYGCGYPVPEAVGGRTLLDLGCGTGRDVYLLAQLVGAEGFVHGVDMTEAQLAVARDTLAWHRERFGLEHDNVAFHHGYIEDLEALDIAPESIDVVVSNCVVNLSPDKGRVLEQAARVLRPGGEVYFSDVFADRRLPPEVVDDPLLYAECLGGAMYRPDFLDLARARGFGDPRIVEEAPIEVRDPELARRVGAARFTSVTVRLFKLDLEPRCEDYGQVATYKGTIPHHEALFRLDDHHLFEAGRPERVCGNTADMLSRTRLADHFTVIGDKSTHYGLFDCAATMAQTQYARIGSSPASCC